MKYWFTGDTHFGHLRTLELSKRPFFTIEEMDQTLINNWNSVVAKEDIVFHIGDFGDYNVSIFLNGKIHLLFGNYERSDLERNVVSMISLRNDFNFESVRDELKLEISIENTQVSLVHEPSHRNQSEFTLFGHIHSLQKVKKNALNVGVDCHNFAPIDYETVLFYQTAIEKHYDDEVFMS